MEQELEQEHPGITQVNRTEDGTIVLDEEELDNPVHDSWLV